MKLRLKRGLPRHVPTVDEQGLASGEPGLSDKEVAVGGRQFFRRTDPFHGHAFNVAGPALAARRIVGIEKLGLDGTWCDRIHRDAEREPARGPSCG